MPDFYQVLNVQRHASKDEIRQAYIRLAHLHHPDKPGGSSARFIPLSKAYEILSDPDKRRMYDIGLLSESTNTSAGTSSAPPPDPNLCQSCGKRDPLKKVKFLQNIGLLFARHSKSIEGRFCKECIENYFWRYTLTTFILGWWGLISFFVTIWYLLSNSFVFIKTLSLKGTSKNRRSKFSAWGILALVLGSLCTFIVYTVSSEATTQQYNSTHHVPVIEATEPSNEKAAEVPLKDPKTYVSLANGTVLYKNAAYLNGLGELTIDNGTNNDAIAKLIRIRNGKSIYTVYIKAHSTYKIKKISDADYKLLFNLGNDWNDAHKAFDVNSSYETFEDTFDFATTEYDDHWQYSTFNVTLNPTVGGHAKTDDVSPEEFGGY